LRNISEIITTKTLFVRKKGRSTHSCGFTLLIPHRS